MISDNILSTTGMNYFVNSNICNAFSLGDIGNEDSFYMYGSPINDDMLYPSISGNFYDNKGNRLFKLVANKIIYNFGKCKKIIKPNGYSIVNNNDENVLDIEIDYKSMKVTIIGILYNKDGQEIYNSKNSDFDAECAFGYNGGGFIFSQKMSDLQHLVAKIFIGSKSKINELLTGDHTEEEISFDGKLIYNANISKCNVFIDSGDFVIQGNKINISDCKIGFTGWAENLRQLVLGLNKGAR